MARQATDEQRWVEAEDLATGRIDRSPRTRRRLVILGVVALGVGIVAALVGVVLGSHSSGPRTQHVEVPLWRTVTSLVLFLVAVAVLLRGLLQVRRSRRAAGLGQSPLAALTFRQRRRVGKQLTGKAPVSPGEVLVLRRVAQDLLRQAGQTRFFLPAFVLLGTGRVLVSTSPSGLVLPVVWVALFAVAAVQQPRRRRRYRAFLDSHPAPAGAPS